MKDYKAICFFDLDGTLLNGESKLDQDVIDAIHQLKENNVLPLIATGRSIKEVKGIMETSGISSIVALNGQYIEVEGEEIYASTFSQDEISNFIEFSLSLGKSLCLYNAYDFWGYEENEDMVKTYAAIHSPLPPISKNKHLEKDVHMLLALTSEAEKDHLYHEAFPTFTYFRNSPSSIDIVKDGNDKGTGVSRLLKALNLEGVETYGFGDGRNDVPLLKAVDHGVAMGNAVDEVKEVAEFVTKKNTEGGLLYAFKHYGLL